MNEEIDRITASVRNTISNGYSEMARTHKNPVYHRAFRAIFCFLSGDLWSTLDLLSDVRAVFNFCFAQVVG
jgi:hypothetical protein